MPDAGISAYDAKMEEKLVGLELKIVGCFKI